MNNVSFNLMFVIETLEIGGAERQLLELIKGLDRNVYNPIVVCFRRTPGLAKEVTALDIPVYYAIRKWRWDPSVVWKIIKLIRANNISLIHAYMPLAGIYGSAAAMISGVPIVNSSIRNAKVPTLYEMALLKCSFALSDVVLANSNTGKKVFSKLSRGKIKVIYNGIDYSRFNKPIDIQNKKRDLNLERFDFVVSMVARLEEVKNPVMFVRVARIVSEALPNTAFLVVGDGSMRKALEQVIITLGLNLNVFLLGSRTDIEEILQITDIGVLTSNSEGLPNTIIEMLASGVPVVATNCEGVREILDHGQTGLCVEINNELSMAEQIIRLLRDDKLRSVMGLKGKQEVQSRFSLKEMVDRTEGIYKELLVSNR